MISSTKTHTIVDQLEMVYYLFQVIAQSNLGENQLSIQPLIHGIIFKTSYLNLISCVYHQKASNYYW